MKNNLPKSREQEYMKALKEVAKDLKKRKFRVECICHCFCGARNEGIPKSLLKKWAKQIEENVNKLSLEEQRLFNL